MLLQAYDFAHLHRTMGVELQMGGADQWGNITAGLELIRRTSGAEASERRPEPAHGLAYKLLLSPSGTKFGKSEDGRVGLARPGADVAVRVLPVLAQHRRPRRRDLPALVHRARRATRSRRSRPSSRARPRRRPAQRALALDITARTHGDGGGGAGDRRFRGDVLERGRSTTRPSCASLYESAGGFTFDPAWLGGGDRGRCWPRPGCSPRRGEARRMIAGGGVTVNGDAGDRPGVRPGADRRGVARRPDRQAAPRDRPARAASERRVRRGGALGAAADDRRPAATAALGEQHERVVQQVGGLAGQRRAGGRPVGAGSPRRPRRPWPPCRTSVASSVTLRPAASTPPSSSDAVYEPAGRSAARSAIVAHSVSSQAKPWRRPARRGRAVGGRSSSACRGGRSVRPGRPSTSSASPSQSIARSTRRRTLPLVSPLRHSRSREREWKWTSPVAIVAASASASMQASIRTRPSAASWTTRGHEAVGAEPDGSTASSGRRSCDGLRHEPDRQAGRGHRGLDVGDRVDPAVEDRGGEHGIGAAVADRGDEVVRAGGPTRGDDRHADARR